jgi:hypothetical protein
MDRRSPDTVNWLLAKVEKQVSGVGVSKRQVAET